MAPLRGDAAHQEDQKLFHARYEIILTVGDTEYKGTMEVLPDPALVADGLSYEDYKEQFDISVKIVDLIADAGKLSSDLEKLYKELNDKKESSKGLI